LATRYGFPVSEDLSGGLLMAAAQLVGIILLLSMNQLIRIEKHIGAMWLAVASSGVTILLSIFLSTNYKRMAVEQQSKAQSNTYNTLEPAPAELASSYQTSPEQSSTSSTSTSTTPKIDDDSDTVNLEDGIAPGMAFTFHSTPNTPASFRRLMPELGPKGSRPKSNSAPTSPKLGILSSPSTRQSFDRLKAESIATPPERSSGAIDPH